MPAKCSLVLVILIKHMYGERFDHVVKPGESLKTLNLGEKKG